MYGVLITGFGSYSNMFLTNLLNRAFFNSAYTSERGGTAGHISLALNPISREDEQGVTDSSLSGDHSLRFAAQKSTELGGEAV